MTSPTALAAPVRGGDDVHGRGPGAVGVLVDLVGHALVVGVGVDGGHQALDDPERLVQDLGHRGQAVGRARGVGDDPVGGLERVVVDAQNDGGVELVLGGGREDHLIGAGVDVLLEVGLLGEPAGQLQGHLAAQGLPREVGRVLLGGDLDVLAVDDQAAFGGLDGPLELALDAVVLEQQSKVLGVREVVDRDDIELDPGPPPAPGRPGDQSDRTR